jgi:hypothetical protein
LGGGATRPTDTNHEAEIYYANLMTDDDPPMPAAHLSKKDIKVRAALAAMMMDVEAADLHGPAGRYLAESIRSRIADLRKELGWQED